MSDFGSLRQSCSPQEWEQIPVVGETEPMKAKASNDPQNLLQSLMCMPVGLVPFLHDHQRLVILIP